MNDEELLEKLTSNFRSYLIEEQKKPHIGYQERRLWNDTLKTYCQLIRTFARVKAEKNE